MAKKNQGKTPRKLTKAERIRKKRMKRAAWRTGLSVLTVLGVVLVGLLCAGYAGFRGPSPTVGDALTMSMLETSALKFVPRIYYSAAEMDAILEQHYRADIPLKPGAADYLRRLRGRGVRLCVATATPEALARVCLERLGVADCFDFILSCDTVAAGKDRPDVFLACARAFGAAPEAVAVFEDAHYAARTAKRAGFYVVGVYDDNGAAHWDEMRRVCDEVIQGWDDLR